jgi:hypothetical protein
MPQELWIAFENGLNQNGYISKALLHMVLPMPLSPLIYLLFIFIYFLIIKTSKQTEGLFILLSFLSPNDHFRFDSLISLQTSKHGVS